MEKLIVLYTGVNVMDDDSFRQVVNVLKENFNASVLVVPHEGDSRNVEVYQMDDSVNDINDENFIQIISKLKLVKPQIFKI